MKNPFKILPFFALLLSLSMFTSSCSDKEDKDEVVEPAPTGNTSFDNKAYDIKNGFYVEGGAVNMYADDPTHFMNYFILTDGTPNFDDDGNAEDLADGKILMMGGLFSPGGTGFTPGTFNYISFAGDINLTEAQREAKYKDKSFFNSPIIVIDTDGDKNFEEEAEINVTGGTIKISGTAPNYTVEYDLTIAGGKNLKGKFTGAFTKLEMEMGG